MRRSTGEIETKIQEFIISVLMVETDIGIVTSLFEGGILDSTHLIELIGFFEKTYQIKVDSGDVTPGNFDTILAMASFVEKKMMGQLEP